MENQLYARYVNFNGGMNGEAEEVADVLVQNQYYKVADVDMGQSMTHIRLKGFEGIFNSVFFEFYFLENGEFVEHDIFDDPDYNPYIELKVYRFTGVDGKQRTFKVGDAVISTDGFLGRITNFCRCENCKVRGFFEPRITWHAIENYGKSDWITDYSFKENFPCFYKIGNNLFGEKPTKEKIQEIVGEYVKSIEKLQFDQKEYKRLLDFLYPSTDDSKEDKNGN